MGLNIAVVLILVITAFAWSSKARGYGLFSGLLMLLCVLCAGGIAFALWEPASVALADNSNSILRDLSWGIGLLGPFAIALLVLRLAVDQTVKANLEFGDAANLVGGGLFGLAAGVITSGMVVLGLSHMRFPPALLGHAAAVEENDGTASFANLWVPVDALTVSLYESLSRNGFASGTPLAERRPDAHVAAAMNRLSFNDTAFVTLPPDSFEVIGRYEIPGSRNELLADNNSEVVQNVEYLHGDAPATGKIVGLVTRLNAGAKEGSGGNIITTPGQVRLVADTPNGPRGFHPIAAVAPPEAGSVALFRFRFDSDKLYVADTGGGSDIVFAYEFYLPENATPTDLIIKNLREPLTGSGSPEAIAFDDVEDRDDRIFDRTIFEPFGITVAGALDSIDVEEARTIQTRDAGGNRAIGIIAGDRFPTTWTLSKERARGIFDIDEDNAVVEGEATFGTDWLAERGLGRNLRVERIASGRNTSVLWIELVNEDRRSVFGRAVESADRFQRPVIIDENGTTYSAIGFLAVSGDSDFTLRITPDRPVRALSEIPTVSASKRDQSLWLIFRPTANTRISAFRLGEEVSLFDPPVALR
ncbi:MAG: hypothetical protein AAGD00_01735 [Planctomycetota bacterium]